MPAGIYRLGGDVGGVLLFSAYVLSGPTRPLWARRREVLGLAADRETGEGHERERRA